MKTIIMAGGRGTRISSVICDIPKPMIKIGGIPVLEHELECLRVQGFTDIIITVSHLGQQIMDYFGDGSGISPTTGKAFGVHIEYFMEEKPLGNAGALFRLKENLSDDFLLLNADMIFDIDFSRMVSYHKSKGALATLFTHPNNHPYDSALICTDINGAVTNWIAKEERHPEFYQNCVNAGIHILSCKALETLIQTEKIDLDRQLLKPLAGTGKMFAYNSPEYVKDMGTPERYEAVCKDFENGTVKAKSLRNKQKAIFIDRDGTINQYIGFLRKPSEFELLPGVIEAIKRINNSGYLAIVITNQPVIARGEVTVSQLQQIHNKMETILGDGGAYLDAIYYCPHHPDKGFEGEIPELKVQCNCRKPRPGMLLQAADEFNLDLENSWIVGDSCCDMEAGRAAGCKTAIIGTSDPLSVQVTSLFDFVDKYL